MTVMLHLTALTAFALQDGLVFDVLAHVCLLLFSVTLNESNLSLAPCGDVLKASAGYLTSPGFPEDYDRNRNCTWTFDSSLSPSVILLRIVDVDLSGAINDSLRITDRTQNLAVIYRYRRDFRDGDVIKVDSSVVIRFVSGSHVSSRRSFVVEYQVFPGILWFATTLVRNPFQEHNPNSFPLQMTRQF